jgi:malate dehydrogenase (decarboxylating)
MSNFSNQIRASSALIKRLKQRQQPVMLMQTRSFTTTEGHRPTIVQKRSIDILHDPWFNKVNSFIHIHLDWFGF